MMIITVNREHKEQIMEYDKMLENLEAEVNSHTHLL
jgi:hypothetical protein